MALPVLPVQGQNPWFVPRNAWDLAVKTEIEGRLSEASLATFRGSYITDQQYPSLTAAIAALPVGGVLEIRQDHTTSGTYTINKACTIRFAGGSVTTTSATANVFNVSANDVTFVRPKITGAGVNVNGTARGIRALGTVATPLRNFTVLEPEMTQFNYIAIETRLVNNVSVMGGYIYQCGYAAVMILSCVQGRASGISITDIVMPTGYTNAYGIAFSHFNSSEPPSRDCVAESNRVTNVPWEGLDTHGGLNMIFRDNVLRNCGVGVAVVTGPGVTTSVAPKNAQVIGNDIADATYSGGIVFVGASTGAPSGAVDDYATGLILGNTVTRAGRDASNYAGIIVYNTRGVVIADNVIQEPAVSGIILYYNNSNAIVTGNTITDAWSETILTQAILFGQYGNSAIISGNNLIRASKTATRVNEHGYRSIAGATAGSVLLGPNNFSGATNPLTDVPGTTQTSSLARSQSLGVSGGTVGFYGGTPVARPAAIANATDAASAITQLNLLLAAQRSQNLIAP